MSDQDRAIKLYAAEISDKSEYTKSEDEGTASEGTLYQSIEVEEATEILTRFTSLIRSTVTAPRELVEAVKGYRVEKERGWPSDRPIDDAYFEACDNLEKLWQNVCSALSAQEPKVCPECGGRGWLSETIQVHEDEYGDAIGEEIQSDCPKCEGSGVIKIKES